jgi:hypothetical protein
MNQSLKSLLALLILVCLIASVLGWTTRGIGGVPGSQFWLRCSGIIVIPAVALLAWADFRRDLAPDLLKKAVGNYFEQNGLDFTVIPVVENSCFFWRVLYQNRFERGCSAVVAFRPGGQFLPFTRPDLTEVVVDIECPGAAFGSVTVPYALTEKHQGKLVRFEVRAETTYPNGKGKMLRFRDGRRTSNRYKSGADTALTIASAATGHMHIKNPATFRCRLPKNVAPQAVGVISQRIIWQPANDDMQVGQAVQ